MGYVRGCDRVVIYPFTWLGYGRGTGWGMEGVLVGLCKGYWLGYVRGCDRVVIYPLSCSKGYWFGYRRGIGWGM